MSKKTNNDKSLIVPKEQKDDKIYDSFKLALSAFPFLPDIFSMLVGKPIEKRRDDFLMAIVQKLKDLEEAQEEFKPENLNKNNIFISTITKCAQAVITEHEATKTSSYKNVIINSVYIKDIDDGIKMLLLKTLESLSGIHILILNFYHITSNSRQTSFSISSQTSFSNWEDAFWSFNHNHNLNNKGLTEEIFITVSKDLEAKNLIFREKRYDNDGVLSYGYIKKTKLGEMFYKYRTGFFHS